MKATTPHLAAPFSITASGAEVVEQNSPEEVESCVRNIIVCPMQYRIEQPSFGVVPVQFQTPPVGPAGLQQQVEAWEPRADLSVIETTLANDQELKLALEID
jgi:phage baseplate assembly protein W